MDNKGVLIGGAIVVVVVVVGLLLMANRATAPTKVNEKDMTAQEYPAGTESAVFVSPVAVSPLPTATAQGAVKEFALTATNFKFSTTEMRVKQGDTVRVVLTNNSTMPHDWTVDEFNAATKTITNGQTDTVEFVANQKGTFEYYCSVGQHRQQGMVGKLIVE